MKHGTALPSGVHFHYRRTDPIVLLHGWPQTGRDWDRVVPALAKIGTVIVPDLRGSGLSDKPQSGFDKVALANDIDALVSALGSSARRKKCRILMLGIGGDRRCWRIS